MRNKKFGSTSGFDIYGLASWAIPVGIVLTQLSLAIFLIVSLIRGLFLAWAQGILVFLACFAFPPFAAVSGAVYFVAGVDIPKVMMVELREIKNEQVQPTMKKAD
jgi:hypothetical protein